MSTSTEQTRDVMNHHLDASTTNQGADAIVRDYDEHAILYTPDRDIQGSVAIRSHLLPGPPGPAPTLRIDHQLLPAWRNGIREDSARPKIFPVHPRIELTIAT